MPRTSDRRELIVDTARSRFTERGYEGTTIGDLATELDISKAAIAYYFPTKDTFLDEFVAPFLDTLERGVDAASNGREAVGAYLDAIIEHHDVAVWMDTDPAIQNHDQFGARLDVINAVLASHLLDGSRKTADRIRAMSVLGGLWRPARMFTAAQLRTHRDEIIDAALAGF